MDVPILITILTLWVLVLVNSFMLIKLYRVVATLKKKELPKNSAGVPTGAVLPIQKFKNMLLKDIDLQTNKSRIILFSSFSCKVCHQIYPFFNSLKHDLKGIHLHIFMLATEEQAKQISAEYKISLDDITLITHEDLPPLGVTGFPFAYYLSAKGKVISKGLVNYKHDFDTLISA